MPAKLVAASRCFGPIRQIRIVTRHDSGEVGSMAKHINVAHGLKRAVKRQVRTVENLPLRVQSADRCDPRVDECNANTLHRSCRDATGDRGRERWW